MILRDYRGAAIRLTDERSAHIFLRTEMHGLTTAIAETLLEPEVVRTSATDGDARLYYRRYETTPIGDKLLCVIVKSTNGDAFVLTAYLTDRAKRGDQIWPGE